MRTLTFFSAKLISELQYKINAKIDYWIFTGGGTKNPILMEDIKDLLGRKNVFVSDEFGFDSSFVESCALPLYQLEHLKTTSAFPNTTGCKKKIFVAIYSNPRLLIFTVVFNFFYYFIFNISKKVIRGFNHLLLYIN